MTKKYETPQIEILSFIGEDVITASKTFTMDNNETKVFFMPYTGDVDIKDQYRNPSNP